MIIGDRYTDQQCYNLAKMPKLFISIFFSYLSSCDSVMM